MAFINEYISEEDIEKYQINEVMNSYQGEGEFPKKYYKHLWTIDKEKESWFMWVDMPHEPLDHTRFTGENFFILHYKDKNIEIVLKKVFEESSVKNIENPYYITWKLDRISKPKALQNLSDDEIIEILKEALNVYANEGIRTKIPQENIIVKLKV
jgi:hypothetical protein